MAKISFNKLNCKLNTDSIPINYNEQTFAVRQYLPIEEKLKLIQNVINNSETELGFYNTIMIEEYVTIGIIEAYTDITFTDKQKENIHKLYDIVVSSGLSEVILEAIPEVEIEFIFDCLENQIDGISKYKNSVMGILDNVSRDYSNLKFDAEGIRNDIANPENIALLKNIMDKMG